MEVPNIDIGGIFLTVPPPPPEIESDDGVKKLKEAIDNANQNAKSGVKSFVSQEAQQSQVLINTLKLRCGTDMCLSKDISLSKDFSCNMIPKSQCKSNVASGKCAVATGRGCTDKCEYENDLGDELCKNQNSQTDCAEHSAESKRNGKGGCKWRSNECLPMAKARTETTCYAEPGCTWASVTKSGSTKNKCITDFQRTAKRGCFGACKSKRADADYDCIDFVQSEEGGICRENTRKVNSENVKEMNLCEQWTQDNLITEDMVQEIINDFDCEDDDCSEQTTAISKEKATELCKNSVCVNDEDSGYQSVLHKVYEMDETCKQKTNEASCTAHKSPIGCAWYGGRCNPLSKVMGCPEIEGQQYWPFVSRPDPLKFDQKLCNSVCTEHKNKQDCISAQCNWKNGRCDADLTFSGNLMIAGQGDSGLCVMRNVKQSNHAKQANESMKHVLNSVDLRVIRKSMRDIGQNMAQGGFKFGQKTKVQNLSKQLVQESQSIRSQATQECTSTQRLRNDFNKRCQNMAMNGRAMPCIMDETNQSNQAEQASKCMQKVMMDSKTIQRAVDSVEDKTIEASGISLPALPIPLLSKMEKYPYFWGKTINLSIITFILTVLCVATFLWFKSSTRGAKGVLLKIGMASFLIGLMLALLGYCLGGGVDYLPKSMHPSYKPPEMKTYVGLKSVPTEGRDKQFYGTMTSVSFACQDDDDCVAWTFENKDENTQEQNAPGFCGMAECDIDECLNNKKCSQCCSAGCIPMVSDGSMQKNTEKMNMCKANNNKEGCKEPCIWIGDDDEDAFCTYSADSWGTTEKEKTPERLWCLKCQERSGLGTLFTSLNTKDENYFKDDKPLVDPLTSSEVACFNLVKNTMAIKHVPEKLWENDAKRIFLQGNIIWAVSILILLSTLFLRNKKLISK